MKNPKIVGFYSILLFDKDTLVKKVNDNKKYDGLKCIQQEDGII